MHSRLLEVVSVIQQRALCAQLELFYDLQSHQVTRAVMFGLGLFAKGGGRNKTQRLYQNTSDR